MRGPEMIRYPVKRHQTAVIPRQTAPIWWPIPSQTEIEDVKYPVKPNIRVVPVIEPILVRGPILATRPINFRENV